MNAVLNRLSLEQTNRIQAEQDSYVRLLRSESEGDIMQEAFMLPANVTPTLIVESNIPRREDISDLGLTIIYRSAPLTADMFRGRTVCGAIFSSTLDSGTCDALRTSLNTCKHYDIPVYVSH